MNIKFPPLVNVDGTFDAVRTFGSQTVVIEATVKGRDATITMNRSEAETLVALLRDAGVGGSATPEPDAPQRVVIGAVKLPGRKA